MPDSSNCCEKCERRRALGLDKDLSIIVILDNIKWCLESHIPFIPIDLSTSVWKSWIKRISYCVKLINSVEKDEVYPNCQLNCEHGCGKEPERDGGQRLSNELVDRDDIVYIVTTSGTTRPLPRLVYVTRSSVQPNIEDFSSKLNITTASVLYCSSPITFDPAILTVLLAIYTGAQLVHQKEGSKEPSTLLSYLRDEKVTHIQTVPSFLRLLDLNLVAKHLLTDDTTVQMISMGGEPCLTGKELYCMSGGSEQVISRVKYFNLYGLTEQSVWSSMHRISSATILSQSEKPVPIGDALSETELVLEGCWQEGATGVEPSTYELVVKSKSRLCYIDDGSGSCVTSLQLPTGDVFSSDMLFQGRKDVDFVKIGGTRINLIALGQRAQELPGVQQTHCLYDSRFGMTVVYVGSATVRNIEQYLATCKLYPGSIRSIRMDCLPVDKHGKVDRIALLSHVEHHTHMTYGKMRDQLKELLPAGMQSDKTFIENGGTSIQALALASQLASMISDDKREHLLVQIILSKSLRELFSFVDTELSKSKNRNIDLEDSGRSKKARISNSVNSSLIDSTRTPAPSVDRFKLLWRVDTGKCVDASPVSSLTSFGEVVLIGSHSHKFFCLGIEDGCIHWTASLGDRIEGTAAVSLEHNLVYVGCYDHHLYCLNLSNGDIVHKHRTGDIIKSRPVVDSRGVVYFGSHDHHIYCTNQLTFVLEWKRELDGAVYATPLLHDHSLYIATLAGSVYALDKVTGKVEAIVKQGSPIFSSPKVCSAGVIICAVDGQCVCRSLSDLQTVIWTYKAHGNIFSTPTVLKDLKSLVFGCHDNRVYSLSDKDGSCLWSVSCDSPIANSPAPLMRSDHQYIVVVSTAGTVYSLNPFTGDASLNHSLPGAVFGSPTLVETKLIVGSRDDYIYCLSV